MTDEQQMRLIGEVVDQLRRGELSPAEALTAVWFVMSPGALSYEQAAIEIRCRVAHLGDGSRG
jgi:hypothetical protein